MTQQELESLKEELLNSDLDFYSAQNYMDIEGDIESAESVQALSIVVDDLEEWASTLKELSDSIKREIEE